MHALDLTDLIPGNYYIYLVTNLINGKFYVGKSNHPPTRWNDHKKIARGGKEKYSTEFFVIHAAIRKYGIDNFKFDIIEEFADEKECYLFETWWIDYLGCNGKFGYNCNAGGEGGVSPNEVSRQRMIDAQNTPEKKKISSEMMKKRHQDNPGFLSAIHKGNQYTKGRVPTQKERDNLSRIFTGRIVSEETKQKISESKSGEKNYPAKLNEIQVLEIRSKYIPNKYGYVKLGKEYGVHDETIRSIIKRTTWKYI